MIQITEEQAKVIIKAFDELCDEREASYCGDLSKEEKEVYFKIKGYFFQKKFYEIKKPQ